MMNLPEIIQLIASTPSTKEKQAILTKHSGDNLLMLSFVYAYNPRFNYYIKIEPKDVPLPGTDDISVSTLKSLDVILSREITGNDARIRTRSIMSTLNAPSQVVLSNIINRDLRCGAGTSIANKVWKNLIPEFPVMLASKYDDKGKKYLVSKAKEGFIVSLKLDGGRVAVKVNADGGVSYFSRAGNELNLFGTFDHLFSHTKNTVFDGELIVKSTTGTEARTVSNGLYTKAVRGTLSKEESESFSIVVWDAVPEDKFNVGFDSTPYRERLKNLNSYMLSDVRATVVECEHVYSLDECESFYERMISRGEEGAIIKTANMPWEDKRSKNMVKMKKSDPMDALCIGYEEGTGKYAGKIGSLICQSSCSGIKFNVGTGLNDSDREKDPAEYIGKIVEVHYNEIISSKDRDTKSLFLPVFKGIRYDLNKANSLAEMS
jgi:ATP-dependent DNA ligase